MPSKNIHITANEVANYVVCPEAWNIKRQASPKEQRSNTNKYSDRKAKGQKIRSEWLEETDLWARLRLYAKVSYCLLVMLAVVVFMLEGQRVKEPGFLKNFFNMSTNNEIIVSGIPQEILFLLCSVGLIIFLWDFFDRQSSKLREGSGIDASSKIVGIKGSTEIPPRKLHSGDLSSLPDVLLKEDGNLIPVDVVPMSSKVQDRHILQLLVSLKIIEENEGKPSPYGILRMGQKGRIVKVKNTPEKQRWLETLLDEMHSIVDGVPAVAAPSFKKCRVCDVKDQCQFRQVKQS